MVADVSRGGTFDSAEVVNAAARLEPGRGPAGRGVADGVQVVACVIGTVCWPSSSIGG